MKTFKRILLVALSIFGIASCVDNPTPVPDNERAVELHPFSIFGDFISLNGPDNSMLDTLFPEIRYELDALHSVSGDRNTLTGYNDIYGGAIFLHNKKAVRVGSVFVNQSYLSDRFEYNGSYSISSNLILPMRDRNNILWQVNNYQGLSYSKFLTMSEMIEFKNIIPGDTLDITDGLNLPYVGAENDEIAVQIKSNKNLTATLVHPDSAKSGAIRFFRLPDNGQISLTTEQMKSIPSHRIYDVFLTHFTFETDTLENGKKVGYFTSYTSSIPLFLKR